jgi:hypothetical protein
MRTRTTDRRCARAGLGRGVDGARCRPRAGVGNHTGESRAHCLPAEKVDGFRHSVRFRQWIGRSADVSWLETWSAAQLRTSIHARSLCRPAPSHARTYGKARGLGTYTFRIRRPKNRRRGSPKTTRTYCTYVKVVTYSRSIGVVLEISITCAFFIFFA